MKEKLCTKCYTSKPLTEFHFCSGRYHSICKECRRNYNAVKKWVSYTPTGNPRGRPSKDRPLQFPTARQRAITESTRK
jgi:hypothetical protein